jgi:hypothetical protein
MFDLLLLPNEQNKARLQYLSSLSPIGTNDAIKITTTAVLKENECPLLPPYIDLFFSFFAQTARWRSQQPRRSNNKQVRWSILTSPAPTSKEELRWNCPGAENRIGRGRRWEKGGKGIAKTLERPSKKTMDTLRRRNNQIHPTIHIK